MSEIPTSPEFKEQGNFKDLIIITSTLYPPIQDKVVTSRRQIGLEFFNKAKDLGIRCIVNDGGSDESFLTELRKFENVEFKVTPNLNMGAGTREAIARALAHTEIPYFMWTVPEKPDLLNNSVLNSLISKLRSNQADIVLANRQDLQSKTSTVSESMPELQRKLELRANKRANALFSKSPGQENQYLDLWFGVKMMNRDGLQPFLHYRSELDKWDTVVTPVLEAYKSGKRVVAVEVPYKYDPAQKQHEAGNKTMDKKRWQQYRSILATMGDEFWKKIIM
jgi:hypothetical protein